jgi:hypothetical protein
MPTAETSPEGSWTFTDYEIVILQIGYAVSDRTQITLTGAPPLAAEEIVPLDFSVKTVVLRDPRLSIAVMGSATGIFGAEGGSGFIGRAGGVVTLCEPAWTCRVGLSMATNLALLAQFSELLSGIGASVRLSRTISLVAEIDTALPLGPEAGEFNGVMGGSGVRFSKANWGIDLGFFVAGKAHAPITGIPWIVGTYRVM